MKKVVRGVTVFVVALGMHVMPLHAQDQAPASEDKAQPNASELDALLGPTPADAPGAAPASVAPAALAPENSSTPAPTGAEQNPTEAVPPAAPESAEATPTNPQPVPGAVEPAKPELLDTIPVAGQVTPKVIPKETDRPRQGGIEEIIVSARRTEENMQDVPVAISAMSSEDLKREQINSPQDLQGRVPSLVIGSNTQMRNTETPTIRGQGASYGTAPGVVIYFAESPIPSDINSNNQGGPGKFFDLSNIQVLKGSQGTLFGRNTTGGALLLEPAKPTEEFSGSLRAERTSLMGQSYEGVVNIPLMQETLLTRAGIKYVDRNGFTKDVKTGKDYDDKHFWTSRLGITWKPTDEINNYILGYYTNSKDNGTGSVIEDINREGLNQALPATVGLGALSQIPGLDVTQVLNLGCLLLNLTGPSSNCGQDILDAQHARGPRKVQLSADPDDILKTGGVIDQFNYTINDHLNLRNIASWQMFKHHFRWDVDGSLAAFNDNDSPDSLLQGNIRTLTEELQLQGTAWDNALKYVFGGYYEKTSAVGGAHGTIQFSIQAIQAYSVDKTSYAPFMQGTVDLGAFKDSLSGLSLTAGVRQTKDKSSGNGSLNEMIAGTIPLLNKSHPTQLDNSAVTWTIGLDYKFDSNLVYGKVSKGYRSGGVGLIAVNPAHYSYAPEFVVNYEVGQKSDVEIADKPVRINSAVYYTDYSNMQKTAYDSYKEPNSVTPVPEFGGATFNVGKAWIAGFEFEGTIQPAEGVTLVANYAFTKGKYTEFNLVNQSPGGQLDCTGAKKQLGENMVLNCVPFQSTPQHQFSVSARYTLPIDESKGEVEGSVTYAWTDKQYSATVTVPENEPGAWLPSYGLLNATLNWRKIYGSSFDVSMYGTNLMDKLYRIQNSNQWNFAYFRSSIYSEPRIIGLTIGYHWE